MANQKRKNPHKNNRTTYRADLDELCKFAAMMNSGGIKRNNMTAAQDLLRQCAFAYKGDLKREISTEEVTKLISKGYALTR